MRGRGKDSRILLLTDELANAIRSLFARSLLVQFFSEVCVRTERAFQNGFFHKISGAEQARDAWQYRFRRVCMHAVENSAFLRFLQKTGDRLLAASMGSFGSFGILCGTLSASFWLVGKASVRTVPSLFVALSLIVLSVPLLHVKRSLGNACLHSFFLHGFLFVFCGISDERFVRAGERGAENHWQALFWAILVAVGGLVIRFSLFPLLAGGMLLLTLLFAVPELCGIGILLLLPFLSLPEHASLILGLAVLFADCVWLWKTLCGRRRLRFGFTDFLVFLFGMLLLFGGAVGHGGQSGVREGLLLCILLSFWFPAVDLLLQKKWRRYAIGSVKLSGAAVACMGIAQYYFGDLELQWVDTARFSDLGSRVIASFSNPNILAVYLLAVAPLMLAGAVDASRNGVLRLLHFAGFLCTLICLVFTWTRGAWLGMLIGLLFFFAFLGKRSLGNLFLFALPAVAAASFLPKRILTRFSSIGLFAESSVRYRFYTWRGVLRMLAAHPFGIGVGDAAFYAVYPQYAVSGTETVMHAHRLLLQIAVSLGVVGAILFLAFLFLLASHTAYGLKHLYGGARCELLGNACSVLCILVMGLFDYVWYHKGMFFLFFVLCSALTLTLSEREGLL